MEALHLARDGLLILHFLGLALLLGPAFLQLRRRLPGVRPVMTAGALVQVVTGSELIASTMLSGGEVSEPKMVVKLLLALAALAVLSIAGARRVRTAAPDLTAAGLGALAVGTAVLW